MDTSHSIEAEILYFILSIGNHGLKDYDSSFDPGIIDSMDESMLLNLVDSISRRLRELGSDKAIRCERRSNSPVHLVIDKAYNIRKEGTLEEISIRPLLKVLLIFFLRHPEGVNLKERESFREELLDIYSVISPQVNESVRKERIKRLTDPEYNTMTENISFLNAALENYFYGPFIGGYKINGSVEKRHHIMIDPITVKWV